MDVENASTEGESRKFRILLKQSRNVSFIKFIQKKIS